MKTLATLIAAALVVSLAAPAPAQSGQAPIIYQPSNAVPSTGQLNPVPSPGVTVSGPVNHRAIYKFTVPASAFICAALTCDVTLTVLPVKTFIAAVYVEKTVGYVCSLVCTSSTLTMTVGNIAGGAQFIASFDVDDPTPTTYGDADAELGTLLARAAAIQGGSTANIAIPGLVSVRLTSGTGNVGNNVTSHLGVGNVNVTVITERLP